MSVVGFNAFGCKFLAKAEVIEELDPPREGLRRERHSSIAVAQPQRGHRASL